MGNVRPAKASAEAQCLSEITRGTGRAHFAPKTTPQAGKESLRRHVGRTAGPYVTPRGLRRLRDAFPSHACAACSEGFLRKTARPADAAAENFRKALGWSRTIHQHTGAPHATRFRSRTLRVP